MVLGKTRRELRLWERGIKKELQCSAQSSSWDVARERGSQTKRAMG